MNYYEHWLGDYTKKTGHLRMAGHGAYRMLLDHYYSTERPLPAAYVDLYLICKALEKAEQATVRTIADEFFPVGPDGLRHNERADEEIERAQKRIAASRTNGKGGGRKPTGNPTGNPAGNPTATRQDTQQPSQQGAQQGTQPDEAFPHAPDPTPNPPGEASVGNGMPEALALPGTLTPATWASWRSHLANLRKPLTPQAERLQLVRLAGHADPEAVVQRAIEHGHRVLEPVGGWPDKGGKSIHEKRAATVAAMRGHRSTENAEPTDITAESSRVA